MLIFTQCVISILGAQYGHNCTLYATWVQLYTKRYMSKSIYYFGVTTMSMELLQFLTR